VRAGVLHGLGKWIDSELQPVCLPAAAVWSQELVQFEDTTVFGKAI
jgi:hypothetical protein